MLCRALERYGGKWIVSSRLRLGSFASLHAAVSRFLGVRARVGHPSTLRPVRVYAIVSEEAPEEAIELFVRREDAETFLDEVRAYDADLAAPLSLEPVELDGSGV